jgi:antitoxin component HigA of HigAB toxin-antitoxin module
VLATLIDAYEAEHYPMDPPDPVEAIKALRAQIAAGVARLERGEFTEVGDADLDDYLEKLARPAGKRTR